MVIRRAEGGVQLDGASKGGPKLFVRVEPLVANMEVSLSKRVPALGTVGLAGGEFLESLDPREGPLAIL